MDALPVLQPDRFTPTRDYLHAVARALGRVQQAFVAPDPHDWHYGLVPVDAGLATQELPISGQNLRAVLDMQAGCLRIVDTTWSLKDYTPPELLNNLRVWLASHGASPQIDDSKLGKDEDLGKFDAQQGPLLGTVFRQLSLYAEHLEHSRGLGSCSPILVYPHHFDLSLSWFPFADDKQLGFGFSTGDETIPEPYLYLTASPEPAGFTTLPLPLSAHWQTEGFSGAVLPYAALQTDPHPNELLKIFAEHTFDTASTLFT